MKQTQRVVIIGGGFAGAFAAKALRSQSGTQIELISDRNYFVFQPLLPEVAAGTINPMDAVAPLRAMLPGIEVRMGEVRSIDFDAQRVEVAQGSRRIPQHRPYDHLVIAPGQQTRLDSFPGFTEHSLCMRDVADAHEFRNHVIQCLEHADVTTNATLKARLLTFVIAGGGFSGVETVGELNDMLRRTIGLYPNVSPDEVRTVLVQRGAGILPELKETLGAYAADKLGKRGVEILCNTGLQRATSTAVYTTSGQRIETATLVTTIGNGPTPLVEQLDVGKIRGRIVVESTLRVPDYPNVWAIGDAALIPTAGDTFAPTTAQFAVREARCVARNIGASMAGRPLEPFTYAPRGTMASIGNYRAVAEVLGLRMSGLTAWILWRGFYLAMLPGFSTKLRVALNWAFDYLLPRTIVQIRTKPRSSVRIVHCAKGDVLFETGQIVDGFYTVVSGHLESRVPGTVEGEDFVRILGAGDHWGERSVTHGFKTLGRLTALEDATLLILAADDFKQLRRGLPVLDDYFNRIPDKIYPPAVRNAGAPAISKG